MKKTASTPAVNPVDAARADQASAESDTAPAGDNQMDEWDEEELHDFPGGTDAANARLFVERARWRLLYVAGLGWMAWDGKRWRRDGGDLLAMQIAREVAGAIHKRAEREKNEDCRKRLRRRARSAAAKYKLMAMVSLAESDPDLAASPDKFDEHPYLLNVENGLLNLKCAIRDDHRAEQFVTKLAGTWHDPEAKCPRWLAFLDRVFSDDADLIGFVQRVVGYTLTAQTTEQVLFILFGSGANGKSVFTSVLEGLLGDYAARAPYGAFLRLNRGGGPRNDIARLAGARCVTASEVPVGARLDETLVKEVTGGDRITARFLFREEFSYKPQFKLWLAGNHKPAIQETGHAMWRRIKLIPFTVTIPPGERDPDLVDKLVEELPGILNWAVEGCRDWQQRGLGEAESVLNATEQYRSESDVVSQFLSEQCERYAGATSLASAIWERFREWCGANGHPYVTQQLFGRRIGELGIGKKRLSDGPRFTVYVGLRLRPESDENGSEDGTGGGPDTFRHDDTRIP